MMGTEGDSSIGFGRPSEFDDLMLPHISSHATVEPRGMGAAEISIYLDNQATTRLDPRIAAVYSELLQQVVGNPGSMHRFGQQAKHQLIQARRAIGAFFTLAPQNIVITSGATEALTMAILSCPQGAHLITSTLEHASVREAVNQAGVSATRLMPLAGRGSISPEQIAEAIEPRTQMIVVTAVNHETGALTDIEAIAAIARQHDLLLVIDAVAYVGKAPWQMPEGRVAVCVSGHKIHAPVGVGCVAYRSRFPLKPLFRGGGQQRGLRGGTESVALTVAFAHALQLLNEDDYETMRRLRDRFEAQLPSELMIHCVHEPRIGSISNIAFPKHDGETLLMQLDLAGVAASHGSACQSGALEPSYVLANMGVGRESVRRSLRFSLSRMTTEAEIDEAVKRIHSILS